jgi:hypothetical protein
MLAKAIDDVAAGALPPGFAKAVVAATRFCPDTVVGIAPAQDWSTWSQQTMQAKRDGAPWDTATPKQA